MYRKKAHLHFIGIGGIGMSGIAKILAYQGYMISGCDQDIDKTTITQLKTLNCAVYSGNNVTQCHDQNIDVVVYSSAIQENHPELCAAQKRGIPTISRAIMLAELMRTRFSIAIAGAHGKTTTTSLISHILLEAQFDPTVIIGGHLKTISTNARFGNGDFLVAEADESDKSLLHLQATIAVITNIDLEHLETYKDLDDIKDTFIQFLNNLPFYGKAFLCIDNEHVRSLLPRPHTKIITYGFSEEAEIQAKNIKLFPDCTEYAVYSRETSHELGLITFNMPGIHNIQNSLAAIAIALELEVPFPTIQHALHNFNGIERRFSFNGIWNGAEIFDDYGHHPIEIQNTALVARHRAKKKLIMIFQPHRYSRTHKLWHQFIEIFLKSKLDYLIITDIYPANEPPLAEITAQNFVQALIRRNPPFPVVYIPYEAHFGALCLTLKNVTSPDDLILLQGAGKINLLSQHLVPK